jgi:hypothetical protein
MPVVIPPGFAESTFVFNGGPSDPMTNVLGLSNGNGETASDIAEACRLAYQGFVGAVPLTYQIASLTFERVTTRSNLAGTMETGEAVSGAVGGAGGQPLPWNTSALIVKRTAVGGRRGRGRWYYMGLTESETSDGAFIPAGVISVVNVAFANFYANLVTAGLVPVVLHDTLAVAPTTITGFEVQARLATQRRRLRS